MEDTIVLDVGEGIGAYVNTTAGEAVVVGAGVGGQNVVNECEEVTTAGLKLCEEDDFVDEINGDTENDVMVIVLGGAGVIVAPHVHIDTHVQTDAHVQENVDACVQETIVASESDGIVPDGNERIRGGVDGCEGATIESCDEVDVNLSEDDAGHVDEDDGDITSDDGEEAGEDTGNDGDTGAVACIALCADGGTGGCTLDGAPEVAFLIMSAAYSVVSGCGVKVALAVQF